jgi:hypothetical protein
MMAQMLSKKRLQMGTNQGLINAHEISLPRA